MPWSKLGGILLAMVHGMGLYIGMLAIHAEAFQFGMLKKI